MPSRKKFILSSNLQKLWVVNCQFYYFSLHYVVLCCKILLVIVRKRNFYIFRSLTSSMNRKFLNFSRLLYIKTFSSIYHLIPFKCTTSNKQNIRRKTLIPTMSNPLKIEFKLPIFHCVVRLLSIWCF